MAEEEKTVYVFEQRGADNVKRELKGIADAFSVTQRDANKAAAQTRDLKRYLEFAQGIKSADDLKKKLAEFPALMTKISGAMRSLKDKEVKGLSNAFSGLTAKEREQVAQLQMYHAEVKKSSGLTAGFGNAIRGAAMHLATMAASMFGLFKVIQWLKEAPRAAMEFEKGLANINTLLGRSHPMYNQYREDLIKLRREVPVVPLDEMTKGLYDTISAGVEAEGAMDANRAMSYAAAAGFAEMGTVVKGTTTLMNAYTISGKEAFKATDFGLKAVEKGKITYEDYSSGISMVAGSAASAKVSLEELHAAISIASRVQKPAQTFTGLNMAISSLASRKSELRALGIEYTTFSDTLRQIHEKAPGPELWNKIMPQMRARRTLQAIDLQWEDFTATLEEFDEVNGATMDKYQERLDSTEYKMEKLNQRFEEAKIKIGEDFNQAMGRNVEVMDEMGNVINEIAPGVGDLAAKFSIWDLTLIGMISHAKQFGDAMSGAMGKIGEGSKIDWLLPESFKAKVRGRRAARPAREAAWGALTGWETTSMAPPGLTLPPPEEEPPPPPPPSRGGGRGIRTAKPLLTPLDQLQARLAASQAELQKEGGIVTRYGRLEEYNARRAIERERETKADELAAVPIAKAMESKKVTAAIASSFGIGIKDALMSGDVKSGFESLGVAIANRMLEALIVSGIISMFSGGGFGGTFMNMLGGGFEREGLVKRPTFAPIAEKRPEWVLNDATVSAIRQGFNPRGGRDGARYGPEDYAGGGGGVTFNINPRLGPILDIETARSTRRGNELLGQREA